MKNFIQNAALLFGFRIRKNFKIQKLFLKNVFKSNFKKHVLLAYITDPFTIGLNYTHSNLMECFTAAEIFNALGYTVDVVDFNLNKQINYSKYDIIYGMGHVLENSFKYTKNKNIIRIFYATGCNTIYSNIATTLRVREFGMERGKLLLNSSRLTQFSQHAQTLLSEAVIVLGNDDNFQTYLMYDSDKKRYHKINAFYYDVYDINISIKDFSKAKKHFLWFGSSGLVHKGLDILLELFSKNDHIILHICGANKREKEFFEYYDDILSKSNNIINHGFVNIESSEFKSIMDTCAFVIFPSVSEGGSPAILNTIANGGLIPIITKLTGLDLNNYGWVIDRAEINLVQHAINESLKLDENELKDKSKKIKTHVRSLYTLKNYKENLELIIKKILVNTNRL